MILRAAWVLPVSRPPIRDGCVEIRADRIVRIAAATELAGQGPFVTAAPGIPHPSDGARDRVGHVSGTSVGGVIDLGQAVLVPGLINPHTHLELTAYHGMLEPGPFWSWIDGLIALRGRPGQMERERQAAARGAWESLRAGVTCVGDISRLNVSWTALREVPIRKVCFAELLSAADDPPRDPVELRMAVGHVEEDELLTVGITPHAPYSVPADHIRAALSLAAERGRPWTTHWAETLEEVAFLTGGAPDAGPAPARGPVSASGRGAPGAIGGSGAVELPPVLRQIAARAGVDSPGCDPLEYLERCRGDAPPGLLAHVNYLDDRGLEVLARAGHTVVYCPRAHDFFGHAPHPLPRMLAAGVRVVVGTDSPASLPAQAPFCGLSLLDELHHLQRCVAGPPAAARLLEMVTIEAARALGLAERIGSIDPGKQADLVAFPCPAGSDDPLGHILRTRPAPLGVWVAGRRVVPDPAAARAPTTMQRP